MNFPLSVSPAGPVVVVGAHLQGLFLQVDTIPREGESVLGHSFQEPLDGGKATSQAVIAARLGAPTAFVTVLSRDARGQRWRAFLEQEGIDLQWCVESNLPTDLGVVLLPPSGIPAIVTILDANRALDGTVVECASPVLRSASVVVCQLEAPQEAALAAFRIARAAGGRTILNPAPAEELTPELLALTDIVIPNEHEARILLGLTEDTEGENGPKALARRLAEHLAGPTVIMTAGAAGAFVVSNDGQEFHASAPRVAVTDTTGAGDAFVGALATRLRLGKALTDAVAFAIQVASLTTTRVGTIPSLPYLQEVAPYETL